MRRPAPLTLDCDENADSSLPPMDTAVSPSSIVKSQRRFPKISLNSDEMDGGSMMTMRDSFSVDIVDMNEVTKSIDYAVTGSGTFKKGMFSINREWKDMKLEDLEQMNLLGQGASGVVYLTKHRTKNLPLIALKIMSAFDRNKRQQILKELAALNDASSPHLVGFYGAFYDDGSISIALEFMEGGSLKDIMDAFSEANPFSPRRGAIPEGILSKIIEQVLLGLSYLHSDRHMVHRDLKPSNILMNRNGIFKLSDFGVSAQLEDTLEACKTFVGTVTYMSPERLKGETYSYPSDVWSLGILVYECVSGRYPYQKEDGSNSVSGFWELLTYIYKISPDLPSDLYSPEVRDFIRLCLQKDELLRPSVEELLKHPFITKNKNKNLEEYAQWTQTSLKLIQNIQKTKAMTREQNSDMIQKKIEMLNL